MANLNLFRYAIKDIEDERDVENFRKRRNLRLPDLIISGEKKCGTKALQFFLLHHPDIIGKNSELQLRGNKNFTAGLIEQNFKILPVFTESKKSRTGWVSWQV